MERAFKIVVCHDSLKVKDVTNLQIMLTILSISCTNY